MRSELEEQDIDRIVNRLIEKIRPIITGHNQFVEDIIYDKKDLSEYLKLSKSTIDKMVSNKEIPHFKTSPGQSGGVRFSKRKIDEWITRHTTPEINQFKGKLG